MALRESELRYEAMQQCNDNTSLWYISLSNFDWHCRGQRLY